MELLIYIGKVSLYWALFLLTYHLLLRRHTFFVWNRVYLIASLIVSFALPFVIYPASAPELPALYVTQVQEVTIETSTQESQPLLSVEAALWIIYLAGALWAGFQLWRSIRQLRDFIRQGEHIELENCTVILIDSNAVGSFSFLKWIVVNRNDYEHHFDAILRHEMVHSGEWHSIDIMLIEVLKIVFWFNPTLIFYKKSMQEVHEFLADSQAPNRERYALFLVDYALNAPIASLTNHFFKPSQIKARINMIYKNRTSKWLLGSYMVAAGLIGTAALIVAGCERRENTELDSLSEKLVEKPKPTTPEKVFTVVENQPEFPGGIQAMYQFLGDNLKYPEAATKAFVSGRVFISFVVTSEGQIQDVQVLKGIGFGCDAEAVRVVKAMPAWKPGRQDGQAVNVRYNLPIAFQIEDEVKETKIKINTGKDTPIYIVDGEEVAEADFKKIGPNTIESINVLKGDAAISLYGEKGKAGALQITLKK